MKKIKNLWAENRVVFVLICILIVCFVAIVVVASSFFLAGHKSNYGDRLVNIGEYPVTDKFKNSYIESIKENQSVTSVNLRISGRIIYVNIVFNNDISLDNAKAVAEKSIDLFSEKNLGYYDIEFSLLSDGDDGFAIMGARNVNGSGVVWNNNTAVESEK